MTTGPILGALAATVLAIGSLAMAHRLRPQPADGGEAASPHPVMSTIGAGLLSGFVLLTSFLVVTGWASRATDTVLPASLYGADLVAGIAVLLYPALAGLPCTLRHCVAVAFLSGILGYAIGEAFQLRP